MIPDARDWPRPFHDRLWRTAGLCVVDIGQVCFAALPWMSTDERTLELITRARADLVRMRREPRPLARPVVILNGYHAWAGVAASLRRVLVSLTSQRARDVLDVSYFTKGSFPVVRRCALDEIGSQIGFDTELDLVGISMGGLVARLLCTPDHSDSRLLHAHRIFTIASPHRGANLARKVHPNQTSRDMRPGAEFITRLNTRVDPRLRCYAQNNDRIVGATNTAPPGSEPFWMPGTRLMSHFTSQQHPVILADIARHLRGEEPLLSAIDASCPPSD
jgi:pimeloyl-ACP methyl ester carboxylesterase